MALLALLVLITGTAGIAAVAASGPTPARDVGFPRLASARTAGVLTGDAIAATVTIPPTTVTTSGRPAPTTTPVPVTTTVRTPGAASPVARGNTGAGPAAVPPPAVAPSPTAAAPPSSWALDANGIAMRLRIEPAQPHVGDTIQIVFETSSAVPADFCCIDIVYVGHTMIYSRFHDQGPCPLLQSEPEQRTSYVATTPGPLAIQLQASRVDLCIAPPRFTTTNLYASTTVLPAGT